MPKLVDLGVTYTVSLHNVFVVLRARTTALLRLFVFVASAMLLVVAVPVTAFGNEDCIPNERFVDEPNGKRVLELRWLMDPPGYRVRLRVPAEYVTWADVGCKSAFMPGYPDPNYTGPFVVGFSVGMSVPGFEPLPVDRRNIFTSGGDWSKLVAYIATLARVEGGESQKLRLIQQSFNSTKQIYLNPDSYLMKKSRLTPGPKPDRYGLKRIGAIGDMERFKTEVSAAADAIDFYYVDHDPIDLWFKCQAEEIKDSTEDPTWDRHPECEMHFRYPRLDATLKARFPRIYMRVWPDVKARIEKLLDSFEIGQLNEGKL